MATGLPLIKFDNSETGLTVGQKINAIIQYLNTYNVPFASQTEVNDGTIEDKSVSPKTLKGALSNVGAVKSVNTQVGDVVLKTIHIDEDTNLYFTDSRADARIQNAINDTITMSAPGTRVDYHQLWSAGHTRDVINQGMGAIKTKISEMDDMSIAGIQDGQIIEWKALESKFIAVDKPTGDGSTGDLSDYLKKSGSVPLDNGYTPSIDQQIATKKYVDDNSSGGTSSQSDWNQTDPQNGAFIQNKPQISSTFKVVDDLTSGGSSFALSAQQGVVLKELIDSGSTGVQVQSDWSETDTSKPAFIKNKPDVNAYVRVDGTTPFTSPQTGVEPLVDTDLATKKYVDTNSGGLPAGGTAGQVLRKVDGTDHNTTWDSLAAMIVEQGGMKFDPSIEYKEGSIVSFEGAVYVRKEDAPTGSGVFDPTDWNRSDLPGTDWILDAPGGGVNDQGNHITTANPIRITYNQDFSSMSEADKLIATELLSLSASTKLLNTLDDRTVSFKGTITDMHDIQKTGLYEGVDVTDAPIQGPILVQAAEDSGGNMGFFVMGQDQRLWTGGWANGATSPTFQRVGYEELASGLVHFDPKATETTDYPSLLLPSYSGNDNLTDGNLHWVQVIKPTGNWEDAIHDEAKYFISAGNESGPIVDVHDNTITKTQFRQWIEKENIVQIRYDSTNKKLIINAVYVKTGVEHAGDLKEDGSVQMLQTYAPTKDQDVATKKYVDDNAGGDLSEYVKHDGSVSFTGRIEGIQTLETDPVTTFVTKGFNDAKYVSKGIGALSPGFMPTEDFHVVSLAYLNQELAKTQSDYTKHDGSVQMLQTYTPTKDQDIATKKYVDTVFGRPPMKAAARLSSPWTVTGLTEDTDTTKTWYTFTANDGANGFTTMILNFGDPVVQGPNIQKFHFVIPEDGTYNVEWALNFKMPETSRAAFQVFVNGTAYDPIDHEVHTADNYDRLNTDQPLVVTTSWTSIKELTKGDVVEWKYRLINNGSSDGLPNEFTFQRATFRIELEG